MRNNICESVKYGIKKEAASEETASAYRESRKLDISRF